MLHLRYQAYTLLFRFEAGTSRGVLRERLTYFLYLTDEQGIVGIGEVAPLAQLSIEATPKFEGILLAFCQKFNRQHYKDATQLPVSFWNELQQSEFANCPSLIFGIETAVADYQFGGQRTLFDNAFSRGEKPLPINGLIWMGKQEFMLKQIADKLAQGYTCLKMKIGAIHFQDELAILKSIRQQFSPTEITLRVDANGAFSPTDALDKLQQLAELSIHSIEQPIKSGQTEEMAALCEKSPVPIALDEELIGIHSKEAKQKLLATTKPAYIVLKPTLIGGFEATNEWIEIAKQLQISWWLTSALESNIGLNAICQYTADKILATPFASFPQGLGTGQLYHNNIAIDLEVNRGKIWKK